MLAIIAALLLSVVGLLCGLLAIYIGVNLWEDRNEMDRFGVGEVVSFIGWMFAAVSATASLSCFGCAYFVWSL